MARAMQEWSLSSTHVLLPQGWALPPVGPSSCPVLAAAAGKGFGNVLKQRRKEKPFAPGRGFGSDLSKKASIEREEHHDDGAALVHADDEQSTCPCGGGENKLGYNECCMRYHQGVPAPDGLFLLKARFSAYAQGIIGYIVSTTHPDNPDFGDNLLSDVQATCKQLSFYKLDILQYEPINEQESTVTFQVVYGHKGRADRKLMEEKSYFVRQGDTWLFKDGVTQSKALTS